MHKLLLLAAVAAFAPATAQHSATAPLPAAAEKDAECLTLSLLAASVVRDDPDKMKLVIAESWYFVGRLDSVAIGPDLKPLLTPIAERLQRDAHLKELGEQCDKLFVARGAALRALSEQSSSSKH